MTPAPFTVRPAEPEIRSIMRCMLCDHDVIEWAIPDQISGRTLWDPSPSEAAKHPGHKFRGGNGGPHHCSPHPTHEPLAGGVVHETTESIGRWSLETFGPGQDPKVHAKRILQEVLELAYATGLNFDEIEKLADAARWKFRKEYGFDPATRIDSWPYVGGLEAAQSRPGELADVAITVANFAHRLGIKLPSEIDRKMAVNRGRSWRCNGDGTGQHIKAETNGVGSNENHTSSGDR